MENMDKEKRSSGRTWIAILIVILILIVLGFLIDLDDLFDAFRDLKWDYLVLGALFLVPGLLMISVRGRYLMDNRASFITTFHTDAISYMIRMFTPVYVPVLRAATFSAATQTPVSEITPALMAERLFEVILRLVMSVLAGILISTTGVAPVWVILWVVALAGLFAGVVFVVNQVDEYLPRLTTWLARLPRLDEARLKGPIDNLGKGLSKVGTTRRMVFSLLLSLLMWGLYLAGHALLLTTVDINLAPVEAIAVAAAVLVVLPPSTPAMIGVYQGVMVAVLTPFRIADTGLLVAYGVIVFAVQAVFWVVTGLWGQSRTRLQVRQLVKLSGFKEEQAAPADPSVPNG
jgi:uncharacterized membrane protein YbhN (UPF0104 family)